MMSASFKRIQHADVPELTPRPIVVRRTGGGLGLKEGHTYRGDYVLVSSSTDGVGESARLCHGSVPVDLVSKRTQDEVNQQERMNSSYHNEVFGSPRSARDRRRDQSCTTPSHLPPRGASSMLHFGGSTLLVDLDDSMMTSPQKNQQQQQTHHQAMMTSPRSQSRQQVVRPSSARTTTAKNNNTYQQQQRTMTRPINFYSSSSQQNHLAQGKTIKTKKPAALTPGALRIMKGQLQNGASVETVVRRTAQAQRDRIYRPRADRVAHEEELGTEDKLQQNLMASLNAAGVESVYNTSSTQQKQTTASIDNFYSPSRRNKQVSTIAFDDDEIPAVSHHDRRPAVDFDPYALSLLSTLPPLSASTDPFVNARQELRRPHSMNSCPGAIVMHTALGHLRAVGAIPFLLDCEFGVQPTKPALSEQEKLQMMEDDLTFGYLSPNDTDDDNSDDGGDEYDIRKDPLLRLSLGKDENARTSNSTVPSSSSASGAGHPRRSKKATHPMFDDALSPMSAREDSPGSAFRKTAMELLAPVPKDDYAVTAISHRTSSSSASFQRRGTNEFDQRLAQKKKDYKNFNKSSKKDAKKQEEEKIDSGITIQIDGRALADPQARVTRPKFRVFTIFCERHPIPGLKTVCRVPYPRPAPHEWSVQDIIVCFGWRADNDIDTSVDNVVGDAFFRNTGLKEHAWEGTLMERRLVFQFFAPPNDDDYYTGDPSSKVKQGKRGAEISSLLRQKGVFHRGSGGGSSWELGNGNSSNDNDFNSGGDDFNFGGSITSSSNRKADGARHQPFRVHDFEMNSSAEAGYQVFTWENFSKEFSRAVGEAFLRGV